MNVLIIGMGHIGKALAADLKSVGTSVTGTTTTPSKVADLQAFADRVKVLRGAETDKVRAAAEHADAIIVAAAPNVRQARTPEERASHYKDVLEETCVSAAAACDRIIFLSSFSVYGDGGAGSGAITEATPVSNQAEPSAHYYHRAEQAVLTRSGGCVLRYPDMYGAPGDLSFPDRVRLAQSYFKGNVIFSADAPLYAIHFEDVTRSVVHALQHNLRGVFNVCENERVPPTNKVVFDAICDRAGLDRMNFLSQIKAPLRQISSQKIHDTGFQLKHGSPDFFAGLAPLAVTKDAAQ